MRAGGDSTVRAGGDSTVRSGGDSTVRAGGDSTVRAGGDSTVRAGGNSTVWAGGNSTVRAGDDSRVRAGDDSTVRAGDDSTVRAGGDSTMRAGGDSTVRAGDDSTVRSGGDSTVRAKCSKARVDCVSDGFELPFKTCTISSHTEVCVDTTALRASISSLVCSMRESTTHTSMLSNVTGGRFDRLCATNVTGNSLFLLCTRAMMSLIVAIFLCSPWRRRYRSSRLPDPHSSKSSLDAR